MEFLEWSRNERNGKKCKETGGHTFVVVQIPGQGRAAQKQVYIPSLTTTDLYFKKKNLFLT